MWPWRLCFFSRRSARERVCLQGVMFAPPPQEHQLRKQQHAVRIYLVVLIFHVSLTITTFNVFPQSVEFRLQVQYVAQGHRMGSFCTARWLKESSALIAIVLFIFLFPLRSTRVGKTQRGHSCINQGESTILTEG